jgi:hypothetical protein
MPRRTDREGPRRCGGLVYVLGPLWLARRRIQHGREMTVLMREEESFDTARTAVQRVVQALGDEVEHAVAFGEPTAVEQ